MGEAKQETKVFTAHKFVITNDISDITGRTKIKKGEIIYGVTDQSNKNVLVDGHVIPLNHQEASHLANHLNSVQSGGYITEQEFTDVMIQFDKKSDTDERNH
jgi:nitrogen fixation protein FixH